MKLRASGSEQTHRNKEAQTSFPGIGRGRVSQMKRTLIRIAIPLGPIVAVLIVGIEIWRIGGGTVGLPTA
jgi:hypothetical protein